MPEQSVWDFVIQLTSIIRTIHSLNFACRILSPSRLLVDHKSRLRLSGVGIFEVIDCENSINNFAQYQVIRIFAKKFESSTFFKAKT